VLSFAASLWLGVPAQQRFLTGTKPRRSVTFARQGCRAGTPNLTLWFELVTLAATLERGSSSPAVPSACP
jgi:hypothetical protein